MATEEVLLKPVSMFTITAKLMKHLVESVKRNLGEEGQKLFQKGVEKFVVEQVDIVASAPRPRHVTEEDVLTYSILFDEEKIEERYKKYAEIQAEAEVEHPVSIYGMMAKVFGHVTKAIVDVHGERGEEVMKQGVAKFGEERGRHIARRAALVGKPNTIENYLTHYDMGRSDLFEYETMYHENEIEQTFTQCAFGNQWKADGMHRYGILYCQMIDPSIAKGYNEKFEVVHDEYILREGCCHFLFQMKE